jgi:hypothetical protein
MTSANSKKHTPLNCKSCEYAEKAWVLFHNINSLTDLLCDLFDKDFRRFAFNDNPYTVPDSTEDDLPF